LNAVPHEMQQMPRITPSASEPSMRWPIHLQLLLPMVSVVLLASFLGTAITSGWIALRVRDEQRESLRRVVQTLGKATFPLTQRVLVQMRGLSGAEFVLIGSEDRLRETTLPVKQPWIESLARIARSNPTDRAVRGDVVALGGRDYLVDFVSVSNRSRPTESATLFILYPEDEMASRIRQAVFPALIAGLIAAAVALAITTWLARRFARPIRTLVGRTATIAQGDFTPMPTSRRNDELRDLAESINRMTGQLAGYERQVRHHERLKTLGHLGASMAHQLRNAATGGRMAIELHLRECPGSTDDESLEVALRQLRLMESYLRQFLSIESSTPAVQQRVNFGLLVTQVLELVRPSCVHAGIDLQWTAPSAPLFLQGDPESLRQLATNLVLNAVEAAATGGNAASPRVWVDLGRTPDGVGSFRVRDTGPGPAPSIHDQLFNSFVTTKPDGFGLGLFVAHQIAERHGGRLSWSRHDDITCFIFEFSPTAEHDHGTHSHC